MPSSSYRLRRRLSLTAKRNITRFGVAFSSACDHRVAKLLANGVERMEYSRVTDQEDKIRLAEDNLRRLVGYMTKQATKLGTFPLVDEKAFDAAVKDLCPMWPFC